MQKVFIILEMCRGGELSDILKKEGRLHEDVCPLTCPHNNKIIVAYCVLQAARVIMRQLAEAVVYMHSNGTVHYDYTCGT